MWPFRRVQHREQLTLEQLLAESSPTTRSGVTVDPDQALRLSAVWACRRLLADVISTLPVDAYRQDSRRPVEPAPQILTTPAADTPIDEWLDQIVMAATGGGNAFGKIVARAGAALRPTQIEPLDPSRVVPITRPDRTIEWRLDGREIDKADLWQFRRYPVPGRPLGLSPIAYHAETIGVGLAAQGYGASFFGDDATPAGILTTDQILSGTLAKQYEKTWVDARKGKKGTAALGGGLKFQPISVKPEESQFLESQKFTVAQVCRIFGVPPELVASEAGASLTYANVEQRDLSLLKYAVGPWLRRLETRLTMLLPRGMFAKFNAGALLRTDLKSRYESYRIALGDDKHPAFLTVDEVRELEDREPLPSGGRPSLEVVA